MPYDLDPKSRRRLFAAIAHHYKQMDGWRKLRRALIANYAGSLYGTEGETKKRQVELALMHQAAQAMTMVLAANNPRWIISPSNTKLAGFAKHFQEALNILTVEIRLQESLQQCALDAFFGAAYMKMFLADAPLVEYEVDVWMDPGQPFAARVSEDDHVFDTNVKDYRHKSFACDRRPVPLDVLEEDRFNPKAVRQVLKEIDGREMRDRSEYGELARGLAVGDDGSSHEGDYRAQVELVDVWLPERNKICTWATAPRFALIDTEPLLEQEWIGPEEGPYRMLNLGPVPDNVVPSSPALHLKLLFDLINRCYRKIANQAVRSKQLLVGDKADEGDIETIRKEPDGGTLLLTNPESAKVVTFGNVDNNLMGSAIHLLQQFDQLAGNLTARVGLGASAPTASQEQSIMAQVARAEGSTVQRFLDFTSKVGRDLGYLLFTDPVKELTWQERIPGTDYTVTKEWIARDKIQTDLYGNRVSVKAREGMFADYDFRVEPQSMPYRSAAERLAGINAQIAATAPFIPFMAQDGVAIDWFEYWDAVRELSGEPLFSRIIKVQGRMLDEGGQSHDATKSPHTVREQIRRNEPSQSTGDPYQAIQGLMSPRTSNGQAA